MAWIESHQELRDHPKTRKLMRLLEIGAPAAIGHLHLLWWWALDYAEQGDLSGYENWEIADAALWEGDPNEFVHALLNCGKPGEAGFLNEGDNNSLHIHDWDEYVGRLIDQREKNAARQRAWRERQRDSNVTHEPSLLKDNVTVTSPLRTGATVPNRTKPNRTVPKEEEDVVASDAPVPAPSPKPQETSFPDGFLVTDEMYNKVHAKYPDLDITEATEEWEISMRSNRRKYRYTDWGAAWLNAMKRAASWQAEHTTNGRSTNGQNKPSKLARSIRNLQREYAGMDEVYPYSVPGTHEDYQASNTPKRLQPPKSA